MRKDHEANKMNAEVRRAWEAKAEFWDERMAEGNQFHRSLLAPATERLLEVQPSQTILDVACGNGVSSRRLAELGARVVACDFSQTFLDRARARGSTYPDRLEYRSIDATNEAELLSLGERRFDSALCNMALMDMVEVQPLFRALSRLLKPGGRFVFSIPHPCFNSSACIHGIEEEDRNGALVQTRYIKVANYLSIPPSKGMGMPGEPEPHYYFNRPLSALFNQCFAAGFVLDGIEEPAFTEADSSDSALGWGNYRQIPPVLVARLRLSGNL